MNANLFTKITIAAKKLFSIFIFYFCINSTTNTYLYR